MEERFLIVGLGNPGAKYEKTRHNLGYMVAEAFAQRRGIPFKKGWRVKGQVALGSYAEKKLAVLLPTTYMNLSGGAVKRLANYYSVPVERMIVVVDDVYLNFGAVRIREKGGAAGHNGMKSVESELGTQEYPRLRMGVGPLPHAEAQLDEFVLGTFDKKEQELLPQFVERGVELLERWLEEGTDGAIHRAGECRPLIG